MRYATHNAIHTHIPATTVRPAAIAMSMSCGVERCGAIMRCAMWPIMYNTITAMTIQLIPIIVFVIICFRFR